MKQRILTLACALFAFVAMASAQEYYMNVKTTDGKVTTYSESEFEKVTFSEWTSLGNCTYTDDFFTTFYGFGQVTWNVEIQESTEQPGLFRLVYPYDGKYRWNDPGDWDTSKTYYLEINACDPDAVFITEQEIGVDWGYGMISVWSLADFDIQRHGSTLEEEKSAGNCGTYEDGIITFPKKTLLSSMSDYNGGAWYYANTNGWFMIVMPGVKIPDYSISISTDGEVDEETKTVTATVTLGEDVETARVALVASSNSSSAIEAVETGEVEYTEITESGTLTFSCEKSGTYYLVAVSYAKDKVRESAYEKISYQYQGTRTWTSLGTCQYTDDFFTTFWAVDNVTWEVEIEECDEQPGLYRLVYPYDEKYPYNDPGDWDTSKTYYLEINACDPYGVYITPQEIGVDWGYGMMSVWSYADYYMSYGYSFEEVKDLGICGTLKDGVITFSETDLLISMANYSGGGWYYANYNGAFKVVLPGASGVNAQQKVSAIASPMDKGTVRNVNPIDVKGAVKKNAKQLID